MGPRERTWVLIAIAVAAMVGIIWYARMENGAPASRTIATSTSGTPAGSVAFAPNGQLVAGFPKSLILGSAAVSGSYSINYSSTTHQYTVEWNSSSSMESLYEAYKAYLPSHGWNIVNDITKYAASRGLYARNASSDVSVAVIATGNGSQISIAYLEK